MADVTEDLRIPNLAQVKELIGGVTASDVGARPDTWMPSASDVGAFASKGTVPDGTNVAEMTLGNGIWDLHANYTYSGLPNEATGQWGTLFINGAVAWLLLANIGKFYFISHISSDSWREVFKTDGSVPMSGALKLFNGTVQLTGGNGKAHIVATDSDESLAPCRYLEICSHPSQADVSKAIVFYDAPEADFAGQKCYNIFGEHNKELLSGEVFDLPLATGFVQEDANLVCKYYKDADGNVTVYGHVKKSDGSLFGNIAIANLPVGYRPNNIVSAVGVSTRSDGANKSVADVHVSNGGLITVYDSGLTATIKSIGFNLSFKAEN